MRCKSSTITFVRVTTLGLAGLQSHGLEVYTDSSIVYTSTLEENSNFKELLDQLAEKNSRIKPKIYQFLKYKAQVLSHIVGNGSMKTDTG